MTTEDDLWPVYCLGCKNPVARAVSNANLGFCDDCMDLTSRIRSAHNPNVPPVQVPMAVAAPPIIASARVRAPRIAHWPGTDHRQSVEAVLILLLLVCVFPLVGGPLLALATMGTLYLLPLLGGWLLWRGLRGIRSGASVFWSISLCALSLPAIGFGLWLWLHSR